MKKNRTRDCFAGESEHSSPPVCTPKRMLLSIGLVVLFAWLPASAQLPQVTLVLNSGQQHLIRNDYDGTASEMSLANLIGNQVPPGSQFIRFDSGTQAYLPTITQDRFGSWGPAGTTVLSRGVAYWLCIPPQGGLVSNSSYEVTLSGTTPSAATTIEAITNYNAMGYPYPVDCIWSNTALAVACPNGSYVYFWNSEYTTFYGGQKSTKGTGWPPAVGGALEAGIGFFLKPFGTNVVSVVEPLPY